MALPTISALREMFAQQTEENAIQNMKVDGLGTALLELERLAPVNRYDFPVEIEYTATADHDFTLLDLADTITQIDFSADNSANLINGIDGVTLLLLSQMKYGLDTIPITVTVNGSDLDADNNDKITIKNGDKVKIFMILIYDPAPYKGDELATDGSFNSKTLNTLYLRVQADFTKAIHAASIASGSATLSATRSELWLSGNLLKAYLSNPSSMILYQMTSEEFDGQASLAMMKNFSSLQSGSVIDSMMILTRDENGKLSDNVISKFEIEDRANGGAPRFYNMKWRLAKFHDVKEKRFRKTPQGVMFLDEVMHSGGLNLIGNKTGDVYFNIAPAEIGKGGKVQILYSVRQISTLPHLAATTRAETQPTRRA